MKRSDAKPGATFRALALSIQTLDDFLRSERPRLAVAAVIEAKDQFHEFGFHRIDIELLLDLGSAPLDLDRLVAEGNRRSVVKSLPRVFLHGAQDMLRVLFGLILIEQGDHLPHHDLGRVVAQLLGDRDQPDVRFRKAAHVHFQGKTVAEKAAVGVNQNDVVRPVRIRRPLHQSLELGPVVVGRRRSGLDIFIN